MKIVGWVEMYIVESTMGGDTIVGQCYPMYDMKEWIEMERV